MDGVITSEQNYWNAAALTVYEKLYGGECDLFEVRSELFYDDKLITLFKYRGINSNCDLAYITYAFLLVFEGSKNVYDMVLGSDMLAFDLYERAAEILSQKLNLPTDQTDRSSNLWLDMQDSFQEWFLGSDLYFENYHRKPRGNREGLYKNEKPIVGLENINNLLKALYEKGARLCIGTGRPFKEAIAPLKLWDVLKYFDQNSIITYDFVIGAEKALNIGGLTKPHPYMFVKAFYGKDFPDSKIASGEYTKSFDKCLVVGDAGADILAAQAMGADFAAVLTGVSGQGAKEYFENQGATFIFDNVMELL